MVQVTHKFNATCMSYVSYVCAFSGHVYFHVYMCGHVCGLIIYMCEFYIPCPHMLIHTRVYYRMVTYTDRPSYV